MNNNKTLNEKIEMDLMNLNKEDMNYITDIIPVDISKFNLLLDKITTVVFTLEKFLLIDYPQTHDYMHNGDTFYNREYYEKEEYYLCIKDDNYKDIKIARILNSSDEQCIVVNPNYLEFIKENLNTINSKILEKFIEYKINRDLDISNYKILSIDEICNIKNIQC